MAGTTGAAGLAAPSSSPTSGQWPDCNAQTASCCGLATKIKCAAPAGNPGGFSCPPGYKQAYWICTGSDGRTYHCGECINQVKFDEAMRNGWPAAGRTDAGQMLACFNGACGSTADFACSIWW